MSLRWLYECIFTTGPLAIQMNLISTIAIECCFTPKIDIMDFLPKNYGREQQKLVAKRALHDLREKKGIKATSRLTLTNMTKTYLVLLKRAEMPR